MGRLEGKVAVITGSGSGMGRVEAILFAQEGAKVAVVDLIPEKGEETVKLVKEAGGEAIFIKTNVAKSEDVKKMAKDPVVFAMANPVPEIMPEEAQPFVRIMATGRSDYPNQINNVLCFPGLFKGALRCYARKITEEMKVAAARAIANIITDDELSEDDIVPSVFNREVAESVARAVENTAYKEGVARKHPDDNSFYHVG